MNVSIWLCLLLPIWLCLIADQSNKQQIYKLVINRIKRKKEGQQAMNEIIKSYIGKECIVYSFQAQVTGAIESIQDNWICIKNANGSEIINIDYITRIREFPKKKNGKKKSVVLD